MHSPRNDNSRRDLFAALLLTRGALAAQTDYQWQIANSGGLWHARQLDSQRSRQRLGEHGRLQHARAAGEQHGPSQCCPKPSAA